MADGYERPPTLVVALTLAGRPALLIGGDHEALAKARKLLDAGARLSVVAPRVDPQLSALAARGRLRWYVREVTENDLKGQHVVVLADRDAERARWLRALRKRYAFVLATVDQPASSDFFFTAKVDAGPVELSLSSGGTAPLLLRRMREQLSGAFDERFRSFAEGLARLRASLAQASPKERRNRLAEAMRGFAIEVRLRYPASEGRACGQDKEEGD